jgi:hypothetical protein
VTKYIEIVIEKAELSDIHTDSVIMDTIIGCLSRFCWNDYTTVFELIDEALNSRIEDLSEYIKGSVDFKCFENIMKRCCWIVVFSREIIATGHKMRSIYRNPRLYLKEDTSLNCIVFKMLQFSYMFDHNYFKVSLFLFIEEFIEIYFLNTNVIRVITKYI